MNMAEVIERQRKELNMTRQELAEKLNVSERLIAVWEEGKQYPETRLIPLLAKVLELRIGELFGEDQGEISVDSNERLDAAQIWRYKRRMLLAMVCCLFCGIAVVGVRRPLFASDGMNYIVVPIVLIFFFAAAVFLLAWGELRFRQFYNGVYHDNVYYDVYLKMDLQWFGLAVILFTLLISVVIPLGIGYDVRGAGLAVLVLLYLYDSATFFIYMQFKKRCRRKKLLFSRNLLLIELGVGLLGWGIFALYLLLHRGNIYFPSYGIAICSVPFLVMQIISYAELRKQTR